VHYISFNNFLNKESRILNNENHVLDLSTGIRLYVKSRLYNGDRKIRSNTLFFRSDGILPIDGFTREKVKPIPIGETV
jgi:hypothetical protein